MYQVQQGSVPNHRDVRAFLALLDTLPRHPDADVRSLFDPRGALIVTRAPGRLDVMGGIADYSGSLVLQWPIAEATFVAFQRHAAPMVRIVSLGSAGAAARRVFEAPLSTFVSDAGPPEYGAARAYFRGRPNDAWAAYAVGAWSVLARERGVRFGDGARLLISSAVPEGKGVSSSAAIEVAVMHALAAAYDVPLDPRDEAILCQRVENLVVGAPCGVMDQMTAVCGRAGELLALRCQPAEIEPSVAVPRDVEFWGIDSGVCHSVSGADYGSVRVGAFMGYRIIADLAGLSVEPPLHAGEPLRVRDSRWRGYLANITPCEFAQRYADRLPEQITGADFLARYGGTTDAVTRIDPQRTYAVRTPTMHPIHENCRVCRFRALLACTPTEDCMQALGQFMYDSHASYSACGLGCAQTDVLVSLVREAGAARGLYGAKITGGGSGGTVAVLARRGAEPAVRDIAAEFERRTGHSPYVFSGSSGGAASFGHLRLAPTSSDAP